MFFFTNRITINKESRKKETIIVRTFSYVFFFLTIIKKITI